MPNRPTVRKILILAANPKDTSALRLDEEVAEIYDGLERSRKRRHFDLRMRWAVNTDRLRRAMLNEKPQIVHFCGHGAKTEGLALEDAIGQTKLVSTDALARLFKFFSNQLECVLLNACYSEVQADAIVQHIDYVIGMSDSIPDKAAIKFAVGFYDALGAGESIENAYEMGCIAIQLEGVVGNSIPVLKKKSSLVLHHISLSKLINVPELPPHFLPRPNQLHLLKQKVLRDGNQQVVITGIHRRVGMQGMGGIGKSVLAAALARDKEVQQTFPDGVMWVTLGQTPQLLACQSYLAKTLGDLQEAFTEIDLGKVRLRELLIDKACLLILDDVWRAEDAAAFNVLGQRCQMLITTRDAKVITALGATGHELSVLSDEQALLLLAQCAEQPLDKLPATARDIARECGNLPLALAMVGAMVQGKPVNRWDNVLYRLHHSSLEKIRQQFSDYPYPDLFVAIHVSVEALELNVRERYLDFAVFPEDTLIPEVVLQRFWEPLGLDEYDTQDVIDELVNKSLTRQDKSGCLTLHDLQLDYVRKQAQDMSALHQRLLNAYARECPDGWHMGANDGYLFQHLAHHFVAAGYATELQQLLLDLRWLQAKLDNTNITALIADYNYLPQNKNLPWLQGALRLSAHILAKDKTQLAGQIFGRLLYFQVPEIQAFLEQAKQTKTTIWLRPLIPSLTPPGGRLLYTLYGHTQRVKAVVITPNGKQVISGSDDKTLKVWNLETGEEIFTLIGHRNSQHGSINTLAVTPNSKQVISGSLDDTLKVWDLETRKELFTLTGHRKPVNAVAVTPNGKQVISGSDDKTLKVWDLETGEELFTLFGHLDEVNAVAVTPNGKQVISGSDDKTLKVWDLETGEELFTLFGHRARVNAVAVTPNGKQVVSGSGHHIDRGDRTLKVWDLETGEELFALFGHSDWVTGVAVTPNGKQVVSVSGDKTVKVWDLETTEELFTLTGHSNWIEGVVVTPDGKQVISASRDKTLKIWNLETTEELFPLIGRTNSTDASVSAIVITPDGKQVISISGHKTLKVWNLETIEELFTLTGHSDWISHLVITPDGKQLISGSRDNTLKIWNLKTGKELFTLTGHSSFIRAIAVTPNGKQVISVSGDNTLKIWNLETGKELFTLTGHNDQVDAVAVTPNSKQVISGSFDETIKVWNLKTGKELFTFSGHSNGRSNWIKEDKNWVTDVVLTPDGRRVISASMNEALKVWDLKTGKELFTLSHGSDSEYPWGISNIAITPDGKKVICLFGNRTLKVWDLETTEELFTFTGHSDGYWGTAGVAVTPNGKQVISASEDNTLSVWNLSSGKVIASFTGESALLCFAIAPDGVTIVVGESLGQMHFWRLERV